MKDKCKTKDQLINDLVEMRRRIAEKEKLQKNEEHFRNLVETTSDWIWEIDENAVYIYVSPQIRDILGYEPEEILGKTPFDLMPPEEASRISDIFKSITDSRERFSELANINFHKDGHPVILETSGIPIFDLSGTFCGYRGIDRDITERKLSEMALQASEKRFKMLAEESPNMIFINKGGRVVYVNKNCEEIMGYSREEYYSESFNFMDLIAPEYKDLIKKNFKIHKSGKDIPPYDYKLITKDGRETAAIITTKLIDYEGEKAILGIITDITERKKVEKALLESEERYRAFFEQAADSIVLIDADTGALIEFNEKAHKNLGYTREEFQKLKIPDFEVIESEKEIAKHIKKIIKEGSDTFETKHRRKDGQIRNIQVNCRAISVGGRELI